MMSNYLDRLVDRLARRPERATRIRLRTLLRGCGYARRHREAMAFIRGALSARGLAAEWPRGTTATLDGWVSIRLVGSTRAPGWSEGAARHAQPPGRHGSRRGESLGRVGEPEARGPAHAAGQPSAPRGVPGGSAPAGADLDASPELSLVAERAVSATVEIRCGDGLGAGVIIHPDGLVLTARHVVHDGRVTCREVAVRLSDRTRLQGLVFRSHWPLDLALLWLDRPGPFAHLPLGNPRSLRLAQPVMAVGHPSAFRNTVTRGIVSNPRARYCGVECVQTDTPIDEGNSGGPLLTLAGEVMAISTWLWGDLDSGKFAVPTDYFAEDIRQALELGRRRCLDARYCRSCGHLEVVRRLDHCPVCGSTSLAHGRHLG